jgi:hypothetical protein
MSSLTLAPRSAETALETPSRHRHRAPISARDSGVSTASAPGRERGDEAVPERSRLGRRAFHLADHGEPGRRAGRRGQRAPGGGQSAGVEELECRGAQAGLEHA